MSACPAHATPRRAAFQDRSDGPRRRRRAADVRLHSGGKPPKWRGFSRVEIVAWFSCHGPRLPSQTEGQKGHGGACDVFARRDARVGVRGSSSAVVTPPLEALSNAPWPATSCFFMHYDSGRPLGRASRQRGRPVWQIASGASRKSLARRDDRTEEAARGHDYRARRCGSEPKQGSCSPIHALDGWRSE